MTPEERLESLTSRRCSLHSLKITPEHNGKVGTVISWDREKNVFAVELDECGEGGKWVTIDADEQKI